MYHHDLGRRGEVAAAVARLYLFDRAAVSVQHAVVDRPHVEDPCVQLMM
jgi:hypothetical protein